MTDELTSTNITYPNHLTFRVCPKPPQGGRRRFSPQQILHLPLQRTNLLPQGLHVEARRWETQQLPIQTLSNNLEGVVGVG